MADTAVAITAGSGTNVDTRTEGTNGNHRQVIVVGDPATNDSVAAVKAASTAPVAADPALVVSISPNSVNANGQATMANSAPVVIASNQTSVPVAATLAAETTKVIGTVNFPSDQAASVAATFTPAAASHVANDCNGAAQTFAAMGLSGRPIMITGASLEIDSATAEATAWRLYLYNITPPSATADDGAWDLPSGDRASYLGYVDLGTAVDLGSTQWVETSGINKQVKLAGTALFGYLVNLTTLTPANVAHIVTLHAVQL
jgi:hypothetical protein